MHLRVRFFEMVNEVRKVKGKALVTLLLLLSIASAISLRELWSYKAGSGFEGLAFSTNGNLGAASYDNCYYVFDPNRNLLNKECGGSYIFAWNVFYDRCWE